MKGEKEGERCVVGRYKSSAYSPAKTYFRKIADGWLTKQPRIPFATTRPSSHIELTIANDEHDSSTDI
ncbi:hypothetical protein SERLA73DRAFT_189513 [Serpula lacrymans var. lacrymans S7.3]|uniref:Uncharacterized protein n=2 Tax=Serpula lacrymans var. lacrymans TaxID=341189 RepID=F8QDS5_SERL3|nr:uncharacterized protein SERLADRAFT_480355 [Serpula lacrymans var. lacrymans S7.9]EGN93746.1 hypothetical protein SERLA73DRAFT_189513 [Serpula lacrymans var. lacrymans S7.3]EGO19116.1 hypothetical protein SERLADRAFT_480355 [Serpula lacrymans var. lacrymans S7.9]